MRAVQVVAPGQIEYVEAPTPAVKPGFALIRTMLLSLCGSDLHVLHHLPPDKYPLPPGTTGHEMIGVVEAMDAPACDVKVGDVALTLAPSSQAMAELFLAPVEHVLALPDGPPLEHLLMAQQLGTVIYACKRLPNVAGKDAVVIGQGSAGLFFDAMLRRMGAERVIGLDVKEARVAAGLELGATHTVNVLDIDALQMVEEITEGRLADLVVEAAGEVETINLTAHLAKVGGQLLYFGLARANSFNFDFWTFFRKYCHTTTSGESTFEPGARSFRMALKLIAQGDIDVSTLLTHRFPFERVEEAYELARTRDDDAIKAVIEMPGY